MISFQVLQGDIMDVQSDVAVVNLFKGVGVPGGATGAADQRLGGLISKLITDGEVMGDTGEVTLIHVQGDDATAGPKRVLVVGLGSSADFDFAGVRSASAAAIARVAKVARHVTTIVHGAGIAGLDTRAASCALAEGTMLGAYRFDKFKTVSDDDRSKLDGVTVVEFDAAKVDVVRDGIASGESLAAAQNLARDLVNEPANVMTPNAMRSIAEQVASDGGFEIEVLDEDTCRARGMGAYCGVAQGSDEPAQFVHITYRGLPENPDHNVWLIGKSITFDSGGLSLKSSLGMKRMKGDMGGGAAVLGAMQAIGNLRPAINVHAVLPTTENMPGAGAQRPGDIVRSMSGTSIEIDNTDAEGRLTLADAIDYAKSLGAARIIDVATLTGAARVALGTGNSALFSNQQSLADLVLSSSAVAGDNMWQLPLDPASKRLNRSEVADLKNSGGASAGSISAAHFISKFAGDTPWVHIDIAATSLLESSSGVFRTPGATGVPTRALVEVVTRLAEEGAQSRDKKV